MLEVVVAFGVLLLLLFSTAPLYVQIATERKNQELAHAANTLLHEKLVEYKYNDQNATSSTHTANGTVYRISWEGTMQELMKACIHWQDLSKRQKKRCDYIRK
ncbi:hypothetical protein [Metabacillus iocasae]|uniref:Type II secretory pathway pseudopilin PulG n=1 Tax=Priestia iocasae TaxID=2291674 RepID=A0ABS2QQ09_9BACI|nr:hypothetical protein [Metabacillus iocasae]MBM7701549.1 type II secretory pathway pseudopilin PulG [Metabacillus iocasae]